MQYTSNAAVSELLSSRSTPPPPPANVAVQASVASAVDYLRTHGRRKGVSSQELARSLKLALIDEDVAAALERHRKVTKDDFGHWLYKSDIPHVTDQVSLLAEVNRRAVVWGRTGVPLEKLLDCYPNAITDVRELVRTGRVVAVENVVVGERSTATIYPRGPLFGVELRDASASASTSLPPNAGGTSSSDLVGSSSSSTSLSSSSSGGHMRSRNDDAVQSAYDLSEELHRGEAVWVLPRNNSSGNNKPEVCRVSSSKGGSGGRAVLEKGSETSVSASPSFERVYSVSLERAPGAHLKHAPVWERPFTSTVLPLDKRAPVAGPVDLIRFGCTSDVQALWRDTAASLPSDESELRETLSLKAEVSRRKVLKKPASKQKRKNYAAAKTTTNAHLNR